MKLRILGLAVLASAALLAGGIGQASAVTTCNGVTANGSTTLGAATDAGLITSVCQIGPFTASGGTNLSGTPAVVNNSDNPSIYKFSWGGGNLTIQEELGNNGLGYNIFIELGLGGVATLNADGSLTPALKSTMIAYQSGPGAPVYLLNNEYLAAGTYYVDTYLGTCAHSPCSTDKSIVDPNYALLFTPNATATPLPGSLVLFGPALGGLGGLLAFRRRQKAAA
jgi:hypothetical protein